MNIRTWKLAILLIFVTFKILMFRLAQCCLWCKKEMWHTCHEYFSPSSRADAGLLQIKWNWQVRLIYCNYFRSVGCFSCWDCVSWDCEWVQHLEWGHPICSWKNSTEVDYFQVAVQFGRTVWACKLTHYFMYFCTKPCTYFWTLKCALVCVWVNHTKMLIWIVVQLLKLVCQCMSYLYKIFIWL